MVYIAVFMLVLAGAFSVFYRSWDTSGGLRRTLDDFTAALKAGEHWRQDVRSATGPLRAEDSADGQLLHIPQKSGEIVYRLSRNALWREAGGNAPGTEVLAGIKSSRMQAENRRQTAAWRWELELAVRRKSARLTPLFTFEAVPHPAENP